MIDETVGHTVVKLAGPVPGLVVSAVDADVDRAFDGCGAAFVPHAVIALNASRANPVAAADRSPDRANGCLLIM